MLKGVCKIGCLAVLLSFAVESIVLAQDTTPAVNCKVEKKKCKSASKARKDARKKVTKNADCIQNYNGRLAGVEATKIACYEKIQQKLDDMALKARPDVELCGVQGIINVATGKFDDSMLNSDADLVQEYLRGQVTPILNGLAGALQDILDSTIGHCSKLVQCPCLVAPIPFCSDTESSCQSKINNCKAEEANLVKAKQRACNNVASLGVKIARVQNKRSRCDRNADKASRRYTVKLTPCVNALPLAEATLSTKQGAEGPACERYLSNSCNGIAFYQDYL